MDLVLMFGVSIFAFFIGIFVGSKSKPFVEQSYDGKMIVLVQEHGQKLFSLELDGDPEELEQKKSVTFKIVSTIPSTENLL